MDGQRGFGRVVATTAMSNVLATAAAGIAGIIIARALGPALRGEYAAIMAWFGIMITIGQLGQSAAATYFVAQDRAHSRDYLATARNMIVVAGSAIVLIGLFVAPLLAGDSSTALSGYRLVFVLCLVDCAAAAYTFVLLAAHIAYWNLARVVQPVMLLASITILYVASYLTLMTALIAVSVTIVLQGVLAYRMCVRLGLTGGQGQSRLAVPLARYGVGHLASSAPALVVSRLDLLVLSMVVPAASLGHYAVAASLTALAMPIVSAVGYVVFPRLAARMLSQVDAKRLQRRCLVVSTTAGVALILPLTVLAPWLVPLVFGEAYQAAVPLVAMLAPAGICRASGQVCGDVLRGQGRPLAVAKAQAVAAGVTVVLMAVLVPTGGAAGAAIASSVGAGVALVLMLLAIIRRPKGKVDASVAADDAREKEEAIRQ